MKQTRKPSRRSFSRAQVRYLAVAWVAVTIILGICAFTALYWALGGGFGERATAEPTQATLAEAQPEPSATPVPEPTEAPEGTGGGGEGVTEPAAQAPTGPTAGSETGFAYGVQVQAVNTGPPEYWMEMAANGIKFNWIKHQIQWGVFGSAGPGQFDWSGYDPMMRAAGERQLKVMLSVVGAPEWSRTQPGTDGPPDDFQLYANFLGELIDHYPGQIGAIEVWNEQNLDRDWRTGDLVMTQADAAVYVRLLRLAYEMIRSKDPNIVVISGALSPTGGWTEPDGRVTAIDDFTYLQWMVDAGFKPYADCAGVHHNGINVPPDMPYDQAPGSPEAATWTFTGPSGNPHHSWSMYSTITGYHQIVGDDMPLCITEFGWPSREGLREDLIVRQGFEFAVDNTQDEQAQYIVRAFELFRELGYVKMAFLFNLNLYFISDPASSDNVFWSLLDSNGGARPAFGAVAEMPKP